MLLKQIAQGFIQSSENLFVKKKKKKTMQKKQTKKPKYKQTNKTPNIGNSYFH